MRRIAFLALIQLLLSSTSSHSQTSDLDLKATEMLLYMIGCERPDEDPLNCTPGCRKPYETGFVRDPSGNLTYNPAVVDRGNGVFDVVNQTGCGGDFLDRYRLDLQDLCSFLLQATEWENSSFQKSRLLLKQLLRQQLEAYIWSVPVSECSPQQEADFGIDKNH